MGLDYRVKCCPDGLLTDRRRGVRVIDCTIRDGGLCNDWKFDPALVRRTVAALGAAGVDVIEMGYRAPRAELDPPRMGAFRVSTDEDIRAAVGAGGSRSKIAVMVDQGKATLADFQPKAESPVDIVRVATYARDIDAAIDFMQGVRSLGYEVSCNVMAVSRCTPPEVDDVLRKLGETAVENVAVVDSFGALLPHHVRYLVRKYRNWLRPDQKVGVHMHNNQQNAFSNTVAAIEEGVDFVDATLFGMGRGAGNCPMELLLMYLDEPRFDVRAILDVVDEYAVLCRDLRWGYHLPYAIAGWLNVHPRQAIEEMKRASPASRAFYESLVRAHPLPVPHHGG